MHALAKSLKAKGLIPNGPIVVFGSGPLQIFVDPHLLSGDLDISVPQFFDEITELTHEIGYGKGDAEYYIEVVPSYVFRPGPNWQDRAKDVEIEGVSFRLPDPLDILLAKLRRLDIKDVRAFKTVVEKTGHPTEAELIKELRDVYDLFYLQKDGKKSVLWLNTEKLWPILFNREIDARAEIPELVLAYLAKTVDPAYVESIRHQLGLD